MSRQSPLIKYGAIGLVLAAAAVLYLLTLDNGFIITQKGSVEYSTNVGSSEHLEFVIPSGGERIVFDGATIA